MPNQDANAIVFHLIDFGCFDDLFLDCCWVPPIDHEPASSVFVCGDNKACVMWSKTGCKHTCTPWPPGCFHFTWRTNTPTPTLCAVLHSILNLQIYTCMHGLLLSWV